MFFFSISKYHDNFCVVNQSCNVVDGIYVNTCYFTNNFFFFLMDFTSLLSQLSELENQNKKEEQRYFSERTAHELTRKHLSKRLLFE